MSLLRTKSSWRTRACLAACLSAWLLATRGEDELHPAPAGAQEKSEASGRLGPGREPDSTNATVEINAALRDSSHLVATSNVLSALHAPKQSSVQDQIQTLFNL